MKVALAQFKPKLAKVYDNIERILDFVDRAIESKCDIVIFPELATSGYTLRDLVSYVSVSYDSPILNELYKKSESIDIVIGYAQEKNGLFYNSAAYFSGGVLLTNRDKIYLPDYGMFEEGRYFARGESIEAFGTRFGKINLLICEEAFHLSVHHYIEKSKSNLTIIISASPFWIYENKEDKRKIWYSICNNISSLAGNFVIYVNRVGFEDGVGFFGASCIYSPFGKMIYCAPILIEGLFISEIDLNHITLAKQFMPLEKDKTYESI